MTNWKKVGCCGSRYDHFFQYKQFHLKRIETSVLKIKFYEKHVFLNLIFVQICCCQTHKVLNELFERNLNGFRMYVHNLHNNIFKSTHFWLFKLLWKYYQSVVICSFLWTWELYFRIFLFSLNVLSQMKNDAFYAFTSWVK